ncbi:MAG: DUF2141 domain-containing protein [bacterium]|nr:DUF2141 domain-containing protein [bacterium]
MKHLILFALATIMMSNSEFNHDALTINFENIKNTQGTILLGIYLNDAEWEKREPSKEYIISKAELKNGRLSFLIGDLPAGSYGIAVLDDANGNEIVDMGIIFPKEGFGFSDYYHSSFLPPKFKDFAFKYPDRREINIKFRYLN